MSYVLDFKGLRISLTIGKMALIENETTFEILHFNIASLKVLEIFKG